MRKPEIARLRKVNVREVFKNEPKDFTQWLVQPENIEVLGEALGIKLQVSKCEATVGPFEPMLSAEMARAGLSSLRISSKMEITATWAS